MNWNHLSSVAAACALCAGTALAAQPGAQVSYRSDYGQVWYVASQDEAQPSPSDLVVPDPPATGAVEDDFAKFAKDENYGSKGSKGCKGSKASNCCCDLEPFHLIPETARGIQIGGWTQVGYHNKNSRWDLFNQNEDQVSVHQSWLYAEKVADGSCGLDWGFRADVVYGVDADNTQAFGNDPATWDYQNGFGPWGGNYGWAMPQLYAEAAYGDLSVKLGHFYTLVGYEVVTAPDNFFYSHAFTMNNSEPFTHTGALATYGVTDNLTLYGGWTLGWDTGFDQNNDGSSWLGGFSYSLNDNVSLTYISTYGNFGDFGPFVGAGSDSYSHSVVLDVNITERLNYVFQTDMVDAGVYDTVGINQYLFYNLNDCWAFGTRVEWWKINGQSNNEATFGVNYKPHTNLVFRPEIKQEWTPADGYDQTIFGIDAIVTY